MTHTTSHARGRVWALLITACITGVEATHIVWTGGVDVRPQTLVNFAVIPGVQALALGLATRLFERKAAIALARFFLIWVVLAATFVVMTVAVGALFMSLALTDEMAFLVLFIPTLQAGTVMLAGARAAPVATVRRVLAHPFIAPVFWIDAVVLPIGWLFANHVVLGMSVAGVGQRRWMGTKLIAASVFFGASVFRSAGTRVSARDRGVLFVQAIVLAALGIEGFVPWIYRLATDVLAPLSRQPLTLLWLEVYGGILLIVVLVAIATVRVLARLERDAASVFAAATIALFLATEALLMNGFLSLQPVRPWAGLSMTFGSMAATLFVTAAVLIASPLPEQPDLRYTAGRLPPRPRPMGAPQSESKQ